MWKTRQSICQSVVHSAVEWTVIVWVLRSFKDSSLNLPCLHIVKNRPTGSSDQWCFFVQNIDTQEGQLHLISQNIDKLDNFISLAITLINQ